MGARNLDTAEQLLKHLILNTALLSAMRMRAGDTAATGQRHAAAPRWCAVSAAAAKLLTHLAVAFGAFERPPEISPR